MIKISEDFVAIVTLLVTIVAIFAGAHYLDKVSCYARWGDKAQHTLLAGCMVNINGTFIPQDKVRFVEGGVE